MLRILSAHYTRSALASLLAAVCLYPHLLLAAPAIETVTPLNFGLFAIRHNATVSALRLSPAGGLTSSGEMIAISGAARGEYRLSGFPPGVILRFEIDDAQLSEGGFGLPEFFRVTAWEHPETLVSNLTGEAELKLGARLQSSGSGTPYGDAPYTGGAQLRVSYWSESEGGFLTFIEQLDVSAQVQSTLTLTEEQALSFGVVAAFPTAGGTARLTLSPRGSLSSVSTGGARLLALTGAQAGKFQLSSAAPNTSININVQTGSIFMTHTTLGLASARFVVKDFTTFPASPAQTNALGALSISVGASLETEATSQGYADGEYRGSYTLTVSY